MRLEHAELPESLSRPLPGITEAVRHFMGTTEGVSNRPRALSWDFCLEHFSDPERVKSDRQASCMQLGYYLASWGMLRGSSYLFKSTNARHYLPVLDVIEEYTPSMAGLTPDRFSEEPVQDLLLDAYRDLGDALLPEGGRRITLVTKVMMGVWGVFPSLDTYFLKTFRGLASDYGWSEFFSRFDRSTIARVGDFYIQNRDEIDALSARYQTMDFDSGQASGRTIPPAKIIDIYGFSANFNRHALDTLY